MYGGFARFGSAAAGQHRLYRVDAAAICAAAAPL